jgi:energy-coupling factor transport system permease protein
MKLHPVTWIVWAAAATLVALIVRHPGYLLVIEVSAIAVRARRSAGATLGSDMRLGLSLLLIPALFNLVFSRAGQTILLELPISLIGGPYTLEALVYGVSAGIQIAAMMLVVLAMSLVVRPTDLLRRMPSSVAQVGMSASMALSFVPQVRGSFMAIREAQWIRGRELKGLRDLTSLVLPVLVLSLERAHANAEGLAARGWGGRRPNRFPRRLTSVCLLGIAVGLAWWSAAPSSRLAGLVLALVGAAGMLSVWRSEGTHARYRPEIWRRTDSLITGVVLGSLTVFILVMLAAPGLIVYQPYPRISAPVLAWPLVLAAAFLAVPALLLRNDPT